MKPRHLLLPLLLLCSLVSVAQQPDAHSGAPLATQTPGRAKALLEALVSQFRALPTYQVPFEVEAEMQGQKQTIEGRYAVEGERFYLQMGQMEIYGEEKIRYVVDRERREVLIDRIDPSSDNLLDNPTHAFDHLAEAYEPTLLGERDAYAALRLTPKAGDAEMSITLTLRLAPLRPQRLTYHIGEEAMQITLFDITPLTEPLKRFQQANYTGYELIDFR